MGEVMDEKALQRVGQGEREFVQQAAGEMRGVDVERRVVSAVISTEDRVPMYDWDLGVCERVTLSAGMSLLRSEPIPFVDSHRTGSIQHALGSARGIRDEVQSGGGVWKVCELHFLQDDPLAERAWQLREQGHVKAVSVGLWLLRSGRVVIDPETTATVQGRVFEAGKVPLVVYTKSLLEEVSMVQTGADGGAAMQSNEAARSGKENEMDPLTQNGGAPLAPGGDQPANVVQQSGGAAPVPPASPVSPASPAAQGGSGNIVPLDAAREAAAQRAATERVLAIQAHGRRAGVDEAVVLECIQSAMTADAAAARFLELAEQSAKPVGQRVHGGVVVYQGASVEALGAGLLMRTLPSADFERYAQRMAAQQGEPAQRVFEAAGRFRTWSLVDVAAQALSLSGVQPSTDRHEMVRQAVSNLNVANIFTTSINARLLSTYEASPQTSGLWANIVPVNNFQTQDRIGLENANKLSRRARGKKAQHQTMGDAKESYAVHEFAGELVIDEQDLIDDNLSVLSSAPVELAITASQVQDDLAYALLLANGQMRDGTDLFHANHGNLPSNAALDETSLGAALTAFRKQAITDAQNSKRKRVLALTPRFLIVPPELEFKAKKLVSSAEILNNTSNAVYGTANVVAGLGLQVIVEPRLSLGSYNPVTDANVSGSVTAWYLAGDPVLAKTLEIGYIASLGQAPRLRMSPLTEGRYGIHYDVQLTRGAKFLDWRGILKNAGA